MLPDCQELILDIKDGVLRIVFNRPHKRNAMSAQLVDEVLAVFEAIKNERAIRVVVLRGSEGNFCAGGDISTMNKFSDNSGNAISAQEAAWEFNRIFGRMITKVNQAPQIVITLLEGAVLGGGFGLACISDIAIADKNARIAMPETGLGLIPAQIAPFVVQRVGLMQARRLALLGERIDGEEAKDIGMVHYLTSSDIEMQAKLDDVLKMAKRCAPDANAKTKALMLQVGLFEQDELLDCAADMFAAAVVGPEGQEGTQAFVQKRKPAWAI